jgi:hypothetical protein
MRGDNRKQVTVHDGRSQRLGRLIPARDSSLGTKAEIERARASLTMHPRLMSPDAREFATIKTPLVRIDKAKLQCRSPQRASEYAVRGDLGKKTRYFMASDKKGGQRISAACQVLPLDEGLRSLLIGYFFRRQGAERDLVTA